MTPDEYGFWLLWAAIEATKEHAALIGGLGLLLVGAAVLLIKATVRIVHDYLGSL